LKPDDDPWQLDRLSAAEAPELCRALEAAKRQLPSARELAALAANLSVQGLPPPNDGGQSPVLRSAARFRIHGLVVGAAALGAVVLSINVARRPAADPQRVAQPSSMASTASSLPNLGASAAPVARVAATGQAPLAPTPAVPEAVSDAQLGAAGSPPSTSDRAPEAVTPNGPRPARPAPDPSLPGSSPLVGSRGSQSASRSEQGSAPQPGSKAQPSELELLRDARLALRSSPALALGLTEQHSALYPRGSMAQERELIAISALARLGRHTAVLSRAQRFEQDFPGSPYRKQIAQMAE